MRARDERHAWQLQKQINQLTDERTECQSVADRAEASLQGTPRLRDRNRFFNSMLNGDLVTYERVAPLWQDFRRNSGRVKRITAQLAAKETEIETVVRRGLEQDDSGYKALMAKLAREKKARRSCHQLTASIRAARNRLKKCDPRVPRTEAARAAADQDASEVSELIRAVRKNAVDVNEKISPHRSFDPNDAIKLDTDFPGSAAKTNTRAKKLRDAKATLDSLERSVKSLISDIAAREKAIEDQQRLYVQKERARFNEEHGPGMPA